jgi:hypothetical protein
MRQALRCSRLSLMGWIHDDVSGHEGFIAGFTPRGQGSELVRELASPEDVIAFPVVAIGAACTCGWRSPRWKSASAKWRPFTVQTSERDEQRALELWLEHVRRG